RGKVMKKVSRLLVATSVLHNLLKCGIFVLAGLAALGAQKATAQPQGFIKFDGTPGNYVEIDYPSATDFTVNPAVAFTVPLWIRPDALHFDNTDGSDPNQQ